MSIKLAQDARLLAALNKQYRHEGVVKTMRQIIEATQPMVASVTDGMIDYSRGKFNNMYQREQDAYIARLKARRLYFVNDIKVPKLVYDWALEQPGTLTDERSLAA